MKYVFAVILGLIFGGFSDDGWGVWVGGFLGFLVAWIIGLSKQIGELEAKLHQLEHGFQPPQTESKANDMVQAEPPVESEAPAQVEQTVDISEPVVAHQQIIDNEQAVAEKTVARLAAETQHQSEPFQETESGQTVVPAEPSAIELALTRAVKQIKQWVVGYFTGGNSLVRTGMLVLFVGVAFLLKYVAERTVVPVEARYVAVVLGSLLLLVLGWRLRHKRPAYALSLQGGGIGVLYLTLFAALRLHQLIPASTVLLCLVAVVVLSASLAVLQNAMALAVIGVIGGFAAPILTSTGSGSHVQLFAYYLLLNLSIFGIAWFKSWRALNVVGFVATFAVGSLWGIKYYQPPYFASVEPFLVAHFLLYVMIAVLFAFKQPPKLKGINDGTLIFGTPIVVFSLQAALVKDMTYGLAYSALVFGVFYVLLAYVIKKMHRPFFKNLIESFIALGVGFATLAIPLGFDGRVTSAMWVAEASALVWVGVRQHRLLPRFSGYALALLGSLAFFVEPAGPADVLPFLNADFVGVLIVVAATAFMGLYVRRYADTLWSLEASLVPTTMLISAVVWWTVGGLVELHKHFSQHQYLLQQLWLLASALVLMFGARKLAYGLLLWCALVISVLMLPLLLQLTAQPIDAPMFLHVSFLGRLVVVAFYLFMAVYCQKEHPHWTIRAAWKQWFSRYFLATAVLLWLLAMSLEILEHLPFQQLLWNELMMAVTVGLLLWFGHKRQHQDFKWAAVMVALLMLVPMYLSWVTGDWPLPMVADLQRPVFNVSCLALFIYFVTHFILADYWRRAMVSASEYSLIISRTLLLLSMAAWFFNGMAETDKFLSMPVWLTACLVFVSASFVLFVWLAHRLKWSDLQQIKYGFTPVLLWLVVMVPAFQDYHDGYGWAAWMLAFVVNYWLLRVYEDSDMKFKAHYHVLSIWMMSFIVVHEFTVWVSWWLGEGTIWSAASHAFMLLLICATLFMLRQRLNWPLMVQQKAYYQWALPTMMWVVWLLLLVLNIRPPGQSSGVLYMPLLNMIDILGLLAVWLAVKMHQTGGTQFFIGSSKVKYVLLAATGFLLLNATMLRCFHYWYGIDYVLDDLLSSFMVQTGFSILWASTAVALMVIAARQHWRHVWLLGLGLMILVVAKLFLVDMSASGSIERIVAFLSVGFLLSLVGYFSPLPPDPAVVATTENQQGSEQ